MKNRGASNFFFGIIAIILGITLYNQFDYEHLEFKNPALAILYIIIFSTSIYFLIKNFINRSKKK